MTGGIVVKPHHFASATLVFWAVVPAGTAADLPGDYVRLLAREVKTLKAAADPRPNPGAMLAAMVRSTKQHAANPSHGDPQLLELALKLGDLAAAFSEKDMAEN